MQPENRNNFNNNDYSKLVEESIANAEERRKKALEEKQFLSDEELENINGGVLLEPPHTDGIASEEIL